MRRIVLAATLLVVGCGYFNSLYNANRQFAAAERAARTGDGATAARQYRDAIERAAVSYRSHPDGRWADDALLLVGRARFALGEYEEAAAAMRALLVNTRDPSVRALGQAYLGAALHNLGKVDSAGVYLDSAIAVLGPRSDNAAFARLWRARAAFARNRIDVGWTDLEAAGIGHTQVDATIEGVAQAIAQRDSARAVEYFDRVASMRDAGRVYQRVDTLLQRMGSTWSPAFAVEASAPLADAGWPDQARDEIALTRAQLALAGNDPEAALELAMQAANAASRSTAGRARRLAARIRLDHATAPEELEEIRTLLLSAFDDPQALALMRSIRAAQILVQQGSTPESSLSLFAAAEYLRDELRAPRLARTLFLQYATTHADAVWAGKAALAAHVIEQSDETRAALDLLAGNAYVLATRGHAQPGSIDRAESQLAYALAGLRQGAVAQAQQRDAMVGRAVAVLDSTRAAARNDSIRIACGALVDSLAVTGIRADSTRSACLRGDTARVTFVLNADTVLLRDTTAARAAPPDTTSH